MDLVFECVWWCIKKLYAFLYSALKIYKNIYTHPKMCMNIEKNEILNVETYKILQSTSISLY